MIEIEITRLIAACVAAVLLGYALYIAAYAKHRNEIRDERNKRLLALKDSGLEPAEDLLENVRIEKTDSWFLGYRLALLLLIILSAAIGWAVGWTAGQETELTWIEDAIAAAAGALIGGLVLDKYIIHTIADGSFFERVEDPIVQRFLRDGEDITVDEVNPVPEAVDPFDKLSFEDKVAIIDSLKRRL